MIEEFFGKTANGVLLHMKGERADMDIVIAYLAKTIKDGSPPGVIGNKVDGVLLEDTVGVESATEIRDWVTGWKEPQNE